MISFKNINVTIKDKTILDNITFDVNENNIVAIIGPNGSGKTTLINTLYPINFKRFNGIIDIDGKSILDYKSKDLAINIAIMPQIKESLDINVLDFIYTARFPYNSILSPLSKIDKEKVDEAIKICKIEDLADKYLCNLSGGELQMVYLAHMLAKDSKYIVLDEPNTFLDQINQNVLFDILMAQKKLGKTILVIMHDITKAIDIADYIVVLKDSKLMGIVEKQDYYTSSLIEDVLNLKKYILDDNTIIYR